MSYTHLALGTLRQQKGLFSIKNIFLSNYLEQSGVSALYMIVIVYCYHVLVINHMFINKKFNLLYIYELLSV